MPATVQEAQQGYFSLGSWARGVRRLFARRPAAPPPGETTAPRPLSAEAGQLSALLRELARTPSDSERPDWDLALVPGGRVGGYRLVRELGRGGFGRVWEAEDQGGRRVALKALKLGVQPALCEDRLLQEADVAARLSHPAIVPVLDMGRCEQGPYLVLELLRGETLAQRLRREALPPGEAVRIALAIAQGVSHAHAHGVVHRDLKPANVFLCEDGQVKLLDFGLAHAFGTVKAAGGTPAYMAPEQWCGAPEDERSDVFSLGVILHQLLAGAVPFPEGAGKTVEAGGLPPALEVEGAPRLGRLVARMLERDPLLRPRRGQEVAEELERLDRPALGVVRALPPRLPAAAFRRPRGAVIAAGLGLAALAALAAGSFAIRDRLRGIEARAPLPAHMRLAVLPFDASGGGPAEAALVDGLGELVAARIRELEPLRESLRVVASQEVVREGVKSPREARSAFGATLALTGSVRWTPGRVTVAASLVDAATSDLLAARDVEVPRGDEQALEQKLVARVAEMLQLQLAASDAPRGPPAAPGAYEFYLQGRGYLQRYDRAENLESAISVFDRALEKDPKYALAWAGKAEALARRFVDTHDGRFLDQGRAAAQRGLELGDALAPVHLTAGLVHAAAGEHADAVRSYQRALEIEPRNADALRELARTFEAAGRYPEAEATLQRAVHLRPDSWATYNALGSFCTRRARLDEAAEYYARVIALTPDNHGGYANLGAVQFYRGRPDEAVKALERSVALRPTEYGFGNLGTLRFFQGRFDEAARYYQRAADLNPTEAQRWSDLGHALLHGGRSAEAREPYRRASMLLERELERDPRDARTLSRLAMVEGATGKRKASLDHIARALSLQPGMGSVQFHAVLVYERAGMRDRAIEASRAAVAAGHPPEELKRAPSLAALRRDPRWATLVSPPAVPPKETR